MHDMRKLMESINQEKILVHIDNEKSNWFYINEEKSLRSLKVVVSESDYNMYVFDNPGEAIQQGFSASDIPPKIKTMPRDKIKQAHISLMEFHEGPHREKFDKPGNDLIHYILTMR